MEFRILGPLEALDGNRAVEIRGDIQRALLAILLLNANAVVATDRLIDELWEDSPPASGNTALQVRVSQLRKGLGQDRDGPIVTRAPGYLIEVGPDQLDLHRFERFVQDASRALEEGDPATASDKLRSALRLWRGPALADFGYADFARAAITRLEELRVAAVELRIEADLVLGRHAQLVSELRGLVLEHPAREQLRAHLMLALFRSGRQSEALAAYQDARREFIEQFGIEPSPALQELEGAILRHDPGLDRSDPQSTSAGSRAAARRAILVLPGQIGRLESLLDIASPLARDPGRELIFASLVSGRADLAGTASKLHAQREQLVADGLDVRAASFTSDDRGADSVRLAVEQSVDLLLVDAPDELIETGTASRDLETVLSRAPCDVGILAVRSGPLRLGAQHPLVVPFGGAQYDWTAVELAAWIAKAHDAPLRLVGAEVAMETSTRDPSRLLARASLIVQKTTGIPAEPELLAAGSDALVEASGRAGVVIAGLSGRRGGGALGSVRHALVRDSEAPVLLVKKGLRPSGLAPRETITRFTWSLTELHAG